MTKSIATTAFFLAAAALANAEVPAEIEWTSAAFTLTYSVTNDGNSNNGLDAGRAGFGSITVYGQSLTVIDSSQYDWQISFQLDNVYSSSTDLAVFSTSGQSNGTGFRIVTTKTASGYTAELNYGGDDNQASKATYLTGVEAGSDTDIDAAKQKLENCETGNSPATVALTWIANENRLYLSIDSSNVAGTPSSTKWIAYDVSDSNTYSSKHLSLNTVSDIANVDTLASVFWSNGGATNGEALQNISLKVHAVSAVPEPSAFGLLAGLGAIALAVSRRRRSR